VGKVKFYQTDDPLATSDLAHVSAKHDDTVWVQNFATARIRAVSE